MGYLKSKRGLLEKRKAFRMGKLQKKENARPGKRVGTLIGHKKNAKKGRYGLGFGLRGPNVILPVGVGGTFPVEKRGSWGRG